MVRIIDQDIPSYYYSIYRSSLHLAREQKFVKFATFKFKQYRFSPQLPQIYVRKRVPFILPHMRDKSTSTPSAAQRKVRQAFKQCVECFNIQPYSGGAWPPESGPTNRSYWYAQATEKTWDGYMHEKRHTWDGETIEAPQRYDQDYNLHPVTWFIQVDEEDFLSFYEEMKAKYGYPWSPTNDPDQIVYRMWQIVAKEIAYSLDPSPLFYLTPGETAGYRAGACDDQSMLHFALCAKALTEIGFSWPQVRERLSCVRLSPEDYGHVVNWWKDNDDDTHNLELTKVKEALPRSIKDAPSWTRWPAKDLDFRFNDSQVREPWYICNSELCALWYYNWFISYAWRDFFEGSPPSYCFSFYIYLRASPGFVETDPEYNFMSEPFTIHAEMWRAGIFKLPHQPRNCVPKKEGTQGWYNDFGKIRRETICTNMTTPPLFEPDFPAELDLGPKFTFQTQSGLYKDGWDGKIHIEDGKGSVSGLRYLDKDNADISSQQIPFLFNIFEPLYPGTGLLQINPTFITPSHVGGWDKDGMSNWCLTFEEAWAQAKASFASMPWEDVALQRNRFMGESAHRYPAITQYKCYVEAQYNKYPFNLDLPDPDTITSIQLCIQLQEPGDPPDSHFKGANLQDIDHDQIVHVPAPAKPTLWGDLMNHIGENPYTVNLFHYPGWDPDDVKPPPAPPYQSQDAGYEWDWLKVLYTRTP